MEAEKYASGTIETWSPEEVEEAYSNNRIILIDVRTPQEYMFEHVEGVLLAPMSFFRPEHLPSQQDKPIVLHCGSGVRSGRVAKMCIDAGIDRIAHMGGGFGAWKARGLPYVGTDMSSGAPKKMKQQA